MDKQAVDTFTLLVSSVQCFLLSSCWMHTYSWSSIKNCISSLVWHKISNSSLVYSLDPKPFHGSNGPHYLKNQRTQNVKQLKLKSAT